MSHKIKILHLEDESSDALLVAHALKRANLEQQCIVVDSKEKFLAALDGFNPDIILADHSLPSFNSIEALELLKKRKNPVPLILVTATMTDEFAVDIINRGAKDYILKDRLERLPSAIKNVLRTRRLEIEREEFLKQLEKKERRFRKLVEHSAGAEAILSSNGKPIYVSPSVKNVLGYSEEESLQLDIPEIIHQEHREVFYQKLEESKRKPGENIRVAAIKIKHKNEKYRWIESTAVNLLHDQDIDGIVVDFRDVTEQKLAEDAITESEEKYRAFFENSLDGILLTAPDGRIFAANAAACEMFRRTEKEICEVGRTGVVDTSDPRVLKAIKDRRAAGNVMVEINMLRKDGTKFPAALSSSIFRNGKGEEMTSMIIRDISEAKRTESKLIASKEKYRQLFQMSPLPNLIYDVNTFEILEVNEAAVDQYGFSRKEFLSTTILGLLPEHERLWVEENIHRIVNEGESLSHYKLISFKKNGELIKAEIYGYNLQFKGRNCRFLICIDVTEKEATLQKLEEKTAQLLSAEKLAKLGYWEVGLQNDYFFWSDEVYKIWGRKKEEFQVSFEKFKKTIHPSDLLRFEEEHALALKGIIDHDIEHRIILPDGGIKWVHQRGKVIKDKEGKPLRLEGSVQDITEQKVNLEKLMQSEARHKGLIQSQTNYIIRTDLLGRYSYTNNKFKEDFGWIYPGKDILGENSMDSIMPYHFQHLQEVAEQCLAHPGKVFQIEIDKPARDGGVKSTLWDMIYLKGTTPEGDEIQCVGIDITERVKAEKALRESNRRYELVSRATSEAIYEWDCRTGESLRSEAYTTLFGYESSDILSHVDSWAEKVHPDDVAIIEELYSKIQGKEESWMAEYRYRKTNGDFAYVVDRSIIVRDENGVAVRMVGAVQDVTEKRKLEELIQDASKFARIGSFEFDFTKGTLYWSKVTKEIHEVDEDYEPNYKTGILFYKEGDSRDRMTVAFKKAVEENIPYDLELQIVTEKGDEVWVRKIGRPTFVNGKCVRINGSFQDITNLKKSELEALKASKEKEVILESIGDAFFAVDENFIVTYWNNRSEEFLHVLREEAIGRNLWNLFPDAIDTDFYRNYHKALQENITIEFEEYLERTKNWFGVTVYPSKNGLSVYYRDVTEQRKANLKLKELNQNLQNYTKELVKANKGLEQFTFIVSHNLRSPVANIIGLGDLLEQENQPAELKEEFLQEIVANVKRLDNIVKDLNDILQVKVELNAQKEIIILEDLVVNIEGGICDIMKEHQVQIITNFDEAPQLNRAC